MDRCRRAFFLQISSLAGMGARDFLTVQMQRNVSAAL
jgi:hypothetical protein